MKTERFEIEVPFGKIVYAVLPIGIEDDSKRYVATCKIIGADVRIEEDDLPQEEITYFAEVLDGGWEGEVINDMDAMLCETLYTLFDDKAQAQEIADDFNEE